MAETLAWSGFAFHLSQERWQYGSLDTLGFIERKKEVVVFGPRRVGNPHLPISPAVAAAESGRRTHYGTLADRIEPLDGAQQAGLVMQRLKSLTFPRMLVVDEIRYQPKHRNDTICFSQLISRRFERTPIVLISKMGFGERGDISGAEFVAS